MAVTVIEGTKSACRLLLFFFSRSLAFWALLESLRVREALLLGAFWCFHAD